MENQYGDDFNREHNVDPNKVRFYKLLIRIIEFTLIFILIRDIADIFKGPEDTPSLLDEFVLSDSCFKNYSDTEYLCFDDTYVYKVINVNDKLRRTNYEKDKEVYKKNGEYSGIFAGPLDSELRFNVKDTYGHLVLETEYNIGGHIFEDSYTYDIVKTSDIPFSEGTIKYTLFNNTFDLELTNSGYKGYFYDPYLILKNYEKSIVNNDKYDFVTTVYGSGDVYYYVTKEITAAKNNGDFSSIEQYKVCYLTDLEQKSSYLWEKLNTDTKHLVIDYCSNLE